MLATATFVAARKCQKVFLTMYGRDFMIKRAMEEHIADSALV